MKKTPDEIKKGLECCADVKVGGICPFDCPLMPLCENGDDGAVQREILALIQQLQAENAEQAERIRVLESRNNALYHTILGVMHFVDKWLDCPAYDPDEDLKGTAAVARAAHAREIALQAIEQLKAERDALQKELETVESPCDFCKHLDKEGSEDPCNRCKHILKGRKSHFEWRGVQKD